MGIERVLFPSKVRGLSDSDAQEKERLRNVTRPTSFYFHSKIHPDLKIYSNILKFKRSKKKIYKCRRKKKTTIKGFLGHRTPTEDLTILFFLPYSWVNQFPTNSLKVASSKSLLCRTQFRGLWQKFNRMNTMLSPQTLGNLLSIVFR